MPLTADREYETSGNINTIHRAVMGAADTLFKGALINIGTDGKAKVAANVASELPFGIMTEQVIGTGGDELIEVESGLIWIPHTGAAQTDVGQLFHASADDTLADGAGSNVGPLGMCVDVDVSDAKLLIDTRLRAFS